MSDHQDQQEIAELEQVNSELTQALKLCHSLVDDYRSKLAASLSDQAELLPANDDESGHDVRLG